MRGPTPQGSSQGLSPSLIQMAPRGDQALVELQRQIYAVTVPDVGIAPTINVSSPENASFPARQVTDIGGEFPAWSGDGRTVHFSLGNVHFSYSLDDARAFEDSVAAAEDVEDADVEDAEAEDGGADQAEEAGEPWTMPKRASTAPSSIACA